MLLISSKVFLCFFITWRRHGRPKHVVKNTEFVKIIESLLVTDGLLQCSSALKSVMEYSVTILALSVRVIYLTLMEGRRRSMMFVSTLLIPIQFSELLLRDVQYFSILKKSVCEQILVKLLLPSKCTKIRSVAVDCLHNWTDSHTAPKDAFL